MTYFSKEIKDKIFVTARLEEVAADFMKLEKRGKDISGKCPVCGKSGKGKGIKFNVDKQLFKCFSCDTSGKGAVKFLMITQKFEYVKALEFLADKYNIDYSENYNAKLIQAQKAKRGKGKLSYVDIQLSGSGLTRDDVTAVVIKDGDKTKTTEVCPYIEGTVNNYYQLIPGYGDDMVILYYDLDGKPIQYIPPKRKRPENFFRIRFQNPEEHKDRHGRPFKYYSPSGSETQLYVPQKIRSLYQRGHVIETLFIQEGEKKAEKACKHDILSVGVMGIQNIGSHNVMPKDLQLLITKCNVKNIVFLLDSDWQDISSKIKTGDNPQQRPLSFFYAIKNYKEYMLSLRNIGVNLEIYFGAVKRVVREEKGLDDVLAGSMKLKEAEFKDDVFQAINSKTGQGEYCEVHKITTYTDYQIKDLWKLNSAKEFAEFHKETLINIPEFKISRTLYRFNDDEEFELAEPILPEEKYWEFTEKGNPQFNYKRAYQFLRNRGYGRLRMAGHWKYVLWKDKVIETVDRTDIKYFINEVTEQIAPEKVLNMLYQGGHFYLGDHSLENLKFFEPLFEISGKNFQNMHFKNKFLRITSDGITQHSLTERTQSVWKDKIINFDIEVLPEPLLDFEEISQEVLSQITDESLLMYFEGKNASPLSLVLTETGQKCHFLQFLINSSNFHWNNGTDEKYYRNIANLPPEKYIDMSLHLLSKLTAFGYMCHRFFDPGTAKAIVAMDGKLSEVGASNGRTGKSILGNAVGVLVPQVYIGGKTRKLTEDQFLFEEVNEKTENVFFDDVRTNFDFEFLFPNITGRWKINAKGVGRWTMKTEDSPKIFIATNHSLNGEGLSFADRQHDLVFSDFYSDTHKPVDDFGMLFFDEWNNEQWNLFYNLVSTSLKLYFQYGLVEAPGRNIRLRKLRQLMGEEFLTWAEEYFAKERPEGLESDDIGTSHLGKKIPRKEMHDEFKSRLRGRMLDYYSSTRFGKCVKYYCEYKGLHFNPHKPNQNGMNIQDFLKNNDGKVFFGIEDKSSGVEYFTVDDLNNEDPF